MRAHARFNRRFRAGALAFAAAVGVVIIPASDAGPVSVEAAKPKPFDSNGKDDAFAVAQSREQGPVIGGATTPSTQRTAAAAEVIPGDPVQGTFGPQVAWPIMPIHAVLMPDGRVMSYGTDRNGVQTAYYDYDVWDPKLGTGDGAHQTLPNGSATDIFCSSQLLLLNGDVEMYGGDNLPASSNTYNDDVTQYRPGSNTLVRTGQMNRLRWYSTATILPNAEVLVQGGSGGADYPEVRAADGSFRLLTGAPTSGMSSGYPKNFVGPDGKVFGLANEKMYRIDPAGTGSITSLGTFPTLNRGGTSTSVMFRPGKILQVGGGLGDSASKLASIIDINGGSPVVSPLPNAQFGRHWGNATVMADGRVIVSGGSAVNNAATGVAYTAEIFDPEAGTWTTADTATRMRLYHSTSLLLPDATVITMGGGTPGPETNLNAEIYYPPYLYDSNGNPAPRPTIDFVANYAAPASSLAITTPDAASVGRVSLVKVGSVTHSFDMDQRFLDLTFTTSGTTVTAALPSNVNETPPGFYMVFVLNSAGVPSEAKFVRIGGEPPPPPPPPPPPSNLVANGGFETNTVAPGTAAVVPNLAGWTNPVGGIEVWRGNRGWAASEGTSFVELDAVQSSFNRLEQVVTTQPGTIYSLSFAHSPQPGFGPNTNRIQLYVNDVLVSTIARSGTNLTQPAWQTASFTLIGTGTDRISIREDDTNKVGALIDDVQLGTTPPPSPPPGQYFVNGGFETNTVAPGTAAVVPNLAGWTNPVGGIEVWRGNRGWAASEGTSFVELDAVQSSFNRLEQVVTTQPGTIYSLSFAHSPQPGLGANTNRIHVYVNNVLLGTIARNGKSLTQPAWQTASFTLTGTGTDRISIREDDTNQFGALIDDVRLTPA